MGGSCSRIGVLQVESGWVHEGWWDQQERKEWGLGSLCDTIWSRGKGIKGVQVLMGKRNKKGGHQLVGQAGRGKGVQRSSGWEAKQSTHKEGRQRNQRHTFFAWKAKEG